MNDINRTKKVYVWEGLNEVRYKSISVYVSDDDVPKEIICPIKADLDNIKKNKIESPFSVVPDSNDEKSKDFYNAIDSEYYYLKRNGDRYRLNEIEQTESFSVIVNA